jgi:hypothetical protein
MKPATAFCIVVFAAGITWSALGQEPHALGLPDLGPYATTTTGIGTTSKNASGAAPSGTPDEESNTAEHDDNLYRGKTSESENPMLRDEGPLHFKTRSKEKIQNVDSLKNLQSSGSDPKFQGSFINSGVGSVTKVAEKANEGREANQQPEDQGDPRFRARHLTFTPEKEDEPKKVQADSSPSPTPSPTTSPTAKKSSDSKQ